MSHDDEQPKGPPTADDLDEVDRRALLRFGLNRVKSGGAWAAGIALEQMADRLTPRVQRPPGALPEMEFLLACTRCGACVQACPAHAIRNLDDRAGLAAGTPYLDANHIRPCVVCKEPPCMPACPTGALRLVDMRDAVMGTAVIERETCLAWTGESFHGQPCSRCVRACPYPGDAILTDESGRPFVDPRHCIGCGLCRAACPTDPRSVEIEPPPRF